MSMTMMTETMNLYILNDVLYDYTPGMCVVAAENINQCRELFIQKFSGSRAAEEFDDARIKVIENVNHPAGVVSYEYGGG